MTKVKGPKLRNTIYFRVEDENGRETSEVVPLYRGEACPPKFVDRVLAGNPNAFMSVEEETTEDFDFVGSTVAEVKDFVGDDPDKAERGAKAERRRSQGPRTSLVRHLERVAQGVDR